jgi:hypothetical protein
MVAHKAIGLALLSAFVFCTVAAQSASAVVAKNTTAFTCVEGAGEKDFNDAHCDTKVTAGTGKFGHVALKTGETTKVVLTNTTSAVMKGELAGAKVEIECQSAKGEGTFTNEEVEKKHTGSGSGQTKMSLCTVLKPAKCTVAEINLNPLQGIPLEGLGKEGNEMGGEIRTAGGILTTFSLGGSECALKEKALEVRGTAIATGAPGPTAKHTGSTAVYTNLMTKETLQLGGKPVEFSLTTTVRRAPVEGKEQNPISATTLTAK